MAKRSATSELNHDNWHLDDDKEDPGTFRRVTGDDLKNRVIRKAKRSLKSSTSSDTSFTGSSPFAAFSGFAASSTPFNNLLKKTDNAGSGRSPLVVDTPNAMQTENGKSLDVPENKSEEVSKESETASKSNTAKPARSIEYYRQLQSLNESILQWMQLHLAKNSCCDFTPVFNDYKKHMDTLNLKYPMKKKEVVFSSEGKGNGLVRSSSTSEDGFQASNFSDFKVNSSFKMESTKKDDETDYGANFSARTTNTSTFSFGIKAAQTATSSVSPLGPTSSSKEEEKVPEKSPFQFSFGAKSEAEDGGASKSFSFAAAIAAKNAEPDKTEAETYEPPKNEFVAVSEEDAIYSKRCKLFFKKGDEYNDKGVGTLYLKSLEGKTQLLVRADTNLGNILLNIMLSASLPMSRTGKNNVLLVCIPNPPIDAKNPDSKEAIPMLIRVKTAEDADELLEVLNKHKS